MDEQDTTHLAEILSVLSQVEAWSARIGARPDGPHPAPRSPLCGDDRKAHPYEVSHSAWLFLSHSVDHLASLLALLGIAGFVSMYAPFTLVRGALENACAAMWLLQPDAQDDRLERRLRLAADDIRNGEQMKELLRQTGPRSEQERMDQVREIARSAGLGVARATKKASYYEIVRAADQSHSAGGRAVATWKLCSGYAHGDLWPTLGASRRTEMAVGPVEGVGAFMIEADLRLLLSVTALAVDLTRRGWQLYDQRCQAPS